MRPALHRRQSLGFGLAQQVVGDLPHLFESAFSQIDETKAQADAQGKTIPFIGVEVV